MSVKKNIIANYLGNAWAALMGFAFVPIYIKYLGPEAYGLVGLFVVLQGMIAILDADIFSNKLVFGRSPYLTIKNNQVNRLDYFF